MTLTYLSAFGLASLLSFILTRSIRNLAHQRGWISPLSAHHIHGNPVPRLGGIAIYSAFMAVGVSILLLRSHLSVLPITRSHTFIYILAAGTLIFLLGLWDDVRSLNPWLKFGVQALAGLILYAGDLRIIHLPLLFGSQNYGWLSLPLTILWVLLITNAFNLIDGLDGLAAGSALFSTFVVFVISLSGQATIISLLTLCLAGSILGFLRFNFSPASIFLGDSGSLFIGFMLSALALAGSQKTPTLVAVAIPVVSFGLPLLETILSVIRRFLNGQSIFSADRNHIHHKLLELGYSQRSAVVMLYGVSAAFGMLSLFLLNPNGPTVGIVLFVVGAGVWVGIQQLGYHEFFELQRVARRAMNQRRIILNNLAVRHAITRLDSVKGVLELFSVLQETFASNDFDGFQLYVAGTSESRPARNDLEMLEGARKPGDRLVWFKEGRSEFAPLWSISLELNGADQRQLGLLTLYRSSVGQPMAFDFDLLVTPFRNALAEALDRIFPALAEQASAAASNVKGVSSAGLEPDAAIAYGVDQAGFAS